MLYNTIVSIKLKLIENVQRIPNKPPKSFYEIRSEKTDTAR